MELRDKRHRRRRSAGFTLIEALVASGIILIVAIGVLPLFLRAMTNNVSGSDSTFVSNAGRSGIEAGLGVSFFDPSMAVASGTTSTVTTESFLQGATNRIGESSEGWGGTAGVQEWTRTTTVRQYNVTTDLDGGTGRPNVFDEPEDGSMDPGLVHIKEIQIDLASPRNAGIFASKRITLHLFRAQ